MRIAEIIKAKRDGRELTGSELSAIVKGYVDGSIPDYQVSALLMAIVFRGMSERELADWTGLLAGSGKILDLSDIPGIKVDKHSTGGVGDKCTLICAPAAAACGVKVPMICGRGLGHTGGTIDKLESIPGFKTALDEGEFRRLLKRHSLAISAQTAEIAPADRKLYALRDVTATVESVPLIASSVMSKKYAEGADALVLDVKTGSGAFMKNTDEAGELARTMASIGKRLGRRTTALITDMDQPLGTCIGNALEVAESVEILRGSLYNDCAELSLELAARMVLLGGAAGGMAEARQKVRLCVSSGAALSKFREVVQAQGGDQGVTEGSSKLPRSPLRKAVRAGSDGFVTGIDAEEMGLAAIALGAGRERMDSILDPAAGIVIDRKIGDKVKSGDVLCVLHYDPARTGDGPEAAEQKVMSAFSIGPEEAASGPLIKEVLE